MKTKRVAQRRAVSGFSKRSRAGATTVEYALLLALVAGVLIVSISGLGQQVKALYARTAAGVNVAATTDGAAAAAAPQARGSGSANPNANGGNGNGNTNTGSTGAGGERGKK